MKASSTFNMDSGSECYVHNSITAESSSATPMSREEKRAAIKQVVDERRRQISVAMQQPYPADVLVTPTAAPPRDAPNEYKYFSPPIGGSANTSVSNPDMELSSGAQACRVDVFPSPRLSPSQQKAWDQHQNRQLRARVNHSLKKDERSLEWHLSLREVSSQIQNQQQKLEETCHEDVRKSPLSMNFDAVIKSISTIAPAASFATIQSVKSDALFLKKLSKAYTENTMDSPFGGSRFCTPTNRMDGSLNRTKNSSLPSKSGRSSSRQLDFGSQNISFEASPLNVEGPFAAVGKFLKHAHCNRMILSQKVSHFFLRLMLNMTHHLFHAPVIRSTKFSSNSP